MSLRCLAVDSNLDIANSYVKEWAERGVRMDRVDTMPEGIKKLMSNDYIFVGINGDATDFLPALKEMRSVTDIPILIVATHFETSIEIEALKSGADLFARWHKTPEDNVSSVLAHIDRETEKRKATRKIMFYKEILVAVLYRTVFVGKTKVDLTTQEYDLLVYFIQNHGKALSYKQIYKRVWGSDYEDAEHDALWSAIKRLRDKLMLASGGHDYIETMRDYGYRFLQDKTSIDTD